MITYPNLYHLKYFSDSVDLGSISAAAKLNNVTHPAISRAISSLEMQLGFQLLDHRKKSFKVTNIGLKVAEQAKALLEATSHFQKFNLASVNEQVILKIGLSKSLSNHYLHPFLTKLKKEIHALNVQVKFGTTAEIIGAVADGSLDFGITIGSYMLPTLKQTTIKKGQFVLAESKSKSNQLLNLDCKNFILTEPRYETEKLKSDYKKKFGKNLETTFEISSWEVIGQLVKNGAGVGLLPDLVVQNHPNDFRIIKTNSWYQSTYEIVVHSLRQSPNKKIVELAQSYIADL